MMKFILFSQSID